MIAAICALVPEHNDQVYMLQVYEKYKRLMYYTSKKNCSDTNLCDDIVQDSVLRLISKIELLKQLEEKALVSYIVVTVRNTAYTYMRKAAKEKEYCFPLDEMWLDISDGNDSLEDLFIKAEQELDLIAVWPKLTFKERFLLEGKYFFGDSDYKLAESLGCSASSIRMMITRARRKALSLMLNKEATYEADERT